MSGYSEDNTVRFMNNITREELAKVLVTTAKHNGIYSGFNTINSVFSAYLALSLKQYSNMLHSLVKTVRLLKKKFFFS